MKTSNASKKKMHAVFGKRKLLNKQGTYKRNGKESDKITHRRPSSVNRCERFKKEGGNEN